MVGRLEPRACWCSTSRAAGLRPAAVAAGRAVRAIRHGAAAGGGVFILDRADAVNGTMACACVWELDRHFHVSARARPRRPTRRRRGLRPARRTAISRRPAAARSAPPITTASATTRSRSRTGPVAIPARRARRSAELSHPRPRAAPVARWSSLLLGWVRARSSLCESPALAGHDLALAGATLLVADAAGDQSYAFALAGPVADTSPSSSCHASIRCASSTAKRSMSAGGEAYYDFGDRWIPLVAQPRPRYAESATLVTPVFDGSSPVVCGIG